MSDISIDGYGVDVQMNLISKAEARKLIEGGLSEAEMNEMTFDSGVVNGLYIGQCGLFVDNYLVDSLEMKPEEAESLSIPDGKLALLRIEQFPLMYIRFETDGEFERSSLELFTERLTFPNGSVADLIYGCQYDGVEYFTESDGGSGPQFFVIGPNHPPVEIRCNDL